MNQCFLAWPFHRPSQLERSRAVSAVMGRRKGFSQQANQLRVSVEPLERRAMLAVTPSLVPTFELQIDSVNDAGITTYTISYENPQFAFLISADASDSVFLQIGDSGFGGQYEVYDADPTVGSPAALATAVPGGEEDFIILSSGAPLSTAQIEGTPYLEPASAITVDGLDEGLDTLAVDAAIEVRLLTELVWDGSAVVSATYGDVSFAFVGLTVEGAGSFTIPGSSVSVVQSVHADLSAVVGSTISLAAPIDSPDDVVLKAGEISLSAAVAAENDVVIDASVGGLTMGEAAPSALAVAGSLETAGTQSLGVRSYGVMPASRETAIISWEGHDAEVVRDSWIVQINRSVCSPSAVVESFGESSITVNWSARALGGDYLRVVAPGASQIDVVAWAATQSGFRRIDPDYVVRPTAVPNDPKYADESLWGLENRGQSGGVVDADIDAEAAWDITTGSRNIVIGVIDTGIDYTHPDLVANIWTNPGEIAGNGIDDDANGYIDDVHGWDFLNDDNNPMDDDIHGTHVAGTIGAVGNNATGVVGVAWQVSMMALKTLGPDGGTLAAAIEAIEYATMMRGRGVNVVATNNSWGFDPGANPGVGLLNAIAAGGAAGILFVAAASNDSNDNDVTPTYPASYNDPSIIAVAATTRTNALAGYSNYGLTRVDIGAPGSAILSTVPGGGYASLQGTSMATPHVAGVVALLASEYPDATAAEIKQAVLESAVPIAALNGKVATGGLLNASGALDRLAEIVGEAAPPPDLRITSFSGSVTLRAEGVIDLVVESSGSLSAVSASEGVNLRHYGTFEVGGDGIKAAAGKNIGLDIAGGIAGGVGRIEADGLTIEASDAVQFEAKVESLAISTSNDAITVTEVDGFLLGDGGINARSGSVLLNLDAGTITANDQIITAGSLEVVLASTADLNIAAAAGSIAVKATDGSVTLANTGSFEVGAAGIIAGKGGGVSIDVAGGVLPSDGVITGGSLVLTATGDVTIKTQITADVDVDAGVADIVIEQDGVSINLRSVNGGDVVVSTTSGVNIVLSDQSIVAAGDVQLIAAGGIFGTSDGFGDPATDPIADIIATGVMLMASTGNLAATVMASELDVQTIGVDNDVDVTLVGSRDIFIGPDAGPVALAASGTLTFRSVNVVVRDPETGAATGNDIIVSGLPVADDLLWHTRGAVRYVVTTADSDVGVTGSFGEMLAAAASYPNRNVDGTTELWFTSAISRPIFLSSPIVVSSPLDIDATRRINPVTGFLTVGRPIEVDGSRLNEGETDGFIFNAGADGARLSGFALYGFNQPGGAAVRVDGGRVTLENNLLGISATGRGRPNANGVVVVNGDGSSLKNNTIVMSEESGIEVLDTVGLAIESNHIGTQRSRRRDYGNGFGVNLQGDFDPTASDVEKWSVRDVLIRGNVIAFSDDVGIGIANGHNVELIDNEVWQNSVGIHVAGDTNTVAVYGNTIVKSNNDGVRITDSSANVTIGGVGSGQANYVGTTSRRSRGLGNRANGIVFDSIGAGHVVVGNTIVGNGTRRRSGQQNGVRVQGGMAVLITDNEISENRGDGVRVAERSVDAAVVVERNRLFKNYGSAITLDGLNSRVQVGDLIALAAGEVANQNEILGNRRYGIEVMNGAVAEVGVNSMSANRRGGISGAMAVPSVSAALLDASTLTVTVNEPLAEGDILYVYLATGSRSKTQGPRLLEAFVAEAAQEEFTIEGLDPSLRIRRGTLVTVMVRKVDASGSSPFAPAFRTATA